MRGVGGRVGRGNIVGVGCAVIAGGGGGVFWMWFGGLFGMGRKYGEAVVGVKYGVKNEKGEMCGGPMYYLEDGLKEKWVGVVFGIFGGTAGLGIGNVVE